MKVAGGTITKCEKCGGRYAIRAVDVDIVDTKYETSMAVIRGIEVVCLSCGKVKLLTAYELWKKLIREG